MERKRLEESPTATATARATPRERRVAEECHTTYALIMDPRFRFLRKPPSSPVCMPPAKETIVAAPAVARSVCLSVCLSVGRQIHLWLERSNESKRTSSLQQAFPSSLKTGSFAVGCVVCDGSAPRFLVPSHHFALLFSPALPSFHHFGPQPQTAYPAVRGGSFASLLY